MLTVLFCIINSIIVILISWLCFRIIVITVLGKKSSDDVKVFFSSSNYDISWEKIKDNIERNCNIYLSVIIPAYNEEERVLNTLNSIIDFMEKRSKKSVNFTYEIIVVDDGSKDNTLLVCKEFWLKKCRASSNKINGQLLLLLSNSNQGKGNAVKLGVLSSLGSLILMADADGATEISNFSKLEHVFLKNKEHCIIFGSRSCNPTDDVKVDRKWYRLILNKIFHQIVLLFICSDIQDTQCGFKLFPRKYALPIFTSLHIKRWAFDIEVVYISKILNVDIMSVPVDWREVKGSKLSILRDSVLMLTDILTLRLLYFLGIWNVNLKGCVRKKQN